MYIQLLMKMVRLDDRDLAKPHILEDVFSTIIPQWSKLMSWSERYLVPKRNPKDPESSYVAGHWSFRNLQNASEAIKQNYNLGPQQSHHWRLSQCKCVCSCSDFCLHNSKWSKKNFEPVHPSTDIIYSTDLIERNNLEYISNLGRN